MPSMPQRMVLTKAGGLDAIRVEGFEPTTPGPREVLIEVAFAGVNFADLLMRLGFYQPRPPYPFTPGYEVSGIIAAIGAEVDGLAVGDRVVAAMSNGGQASHVVTSTDRTVRLPDDVSLETAAAMPVTYLTAHHMLHHLGHLRAEDRVLIHGGGGGVGTAALQLCRWAGVTEVWATASAPKADIIRSLGGRPIDRHAEDFVEVVRGATDGQGVDHILDPIGGNHIARSLSVLREGGRLYAFGFSSAAPRARRTPLRSLLAWRRRTRVDPYRLMMRNRAIYGVHMGTWSNDGILLPQLEHIIEGLVEGALEPVIDSILPLAEAAEAHAHLHSGANVGKVLLSMS